MNAGHGVLRVELAEANDLDDVSVLLEVEQNRLHLLVLGGFSPDGELAGFGIELDFQIGGQASEQRADNVLGEDGVGATNFIDGELRLLDDGDAAAGGSARRRVSVHLFGKLLDLL